jgi:hypothetical protein
MKPNSLLVMLGLVLTGCNDSPPPPAPAPQSERTDYLSQAAQASKRASKTVDLAAVKKAIETFYVQEGRFPTNLLELAALDYIRMIPTLPEGMVWNYDAKSGIVSVEKDGVKD